MFVLRIGLIGGLIGALMVPCSNEGLATDCLAPASGTKPFFRSPSNAHEVAREIRGMAAQSEVEIQARLAGLPEKVRGNMQVVEAIVRLYLKRKDKNTALKWAAQAVALQPRSQPARVVLVSTLCQMQLFRRAYGRWEEAAKDFGESPCLQFLKMKNGIYQRLKKQIRPRMPDFKTLKKKEAKEALDLLEWGVATFPKTRTLRIWLVQGLLENGCCAKALEQVKAAYALYPDFHELQKLYVKIHLLCSKRELKHGSFYASMQLFTEGADVLEKLVHEHPHNRHTLYFDQQYGKAKVHYQRRLEEAVFLNRHRGNWDAAEKLCQLGRKFFPNETHFRSAFIRNGSRSSGRLEYARFYETAL